MKITGGIFKGRFLKTPRGIRPAQSMVRKAIFDTLGNVEGKNILDVFAGSGSLGFEALSRGASFCTFVEKNRRCVKIIRENTEILGLREKVKILKMDFKNFLKINEEKFDIIFVDPPYRLILRADELLSLLKFLKKNGILIMETRKKTEFEEKIKNLILKEAVYGQTKITYFTGDLPGEF